MGAVYCVYLKIKIKNENGAINALRNKIDRHEVERINYNIPKWKEEGVTIDTLDNLIRIFLAGWKRNQFRSWQDNEWRCFDNGFDASYGWESVMIEFFEELAPFLEDGSTFYIEPDNDYDEFTVKNGKSVQLH